jgi:hypothetical protein
VVSAADDRINAQTGWLKSLGLDDTTFNEVKALWERSIRAWASGDPEQHEKVNMEIAEMRKKYGRDMVPFTKEEMESIPDFTAELPTWHSIPNDYLTELGHFHKKWLAVFGEVDQMVPTQASIDNIIHYMAVSGNKDYMIAVIPRCGHAPIDTEPKQRIPFENLFINWLNYNVFSTVEE